MAAAFWPDELCLRTRNRRATEEPADKNAVTICDRIHTVLMPTNVIYRLDRTEFSDPARAHQ